MVSLSPAPAETSPKAKVASNFNLIARYLLNITHNRLNIAHNRLNIPLTKTAWIPKTGRADWQK